MRKLIFLLVCCLTGMLIAGTSSALDEDWYKGCQIASGAVTSSVGLGSFVCANFGDSDTLNDESKMLSVSSCDNFDVLYFPDRDGTANDAATVQIYSCGAPADSNGVVPGNPAFDATGICWILQDTTLDGDPSTNTEAIYGAAAEWIFALTASIDVSPNTDDPLVIIRCNPANL